MFRTVLANVAHLMSGSACAAAMGVLTLAILARSLGPASLGLLVMVDAYGRVIDQLIRLETWQCIVRYGAAAVEERDGERLRRLIKFGLMMDLTGATCAAGVAFVLVPVAARWLDWDATTMEWARIASLALLLRASSTPTGILQLFGRFPVIAWSDAIAAGTRLVGTAAVWLLDGPIVAYLMLMIFTPGVQRVVLSVLSWRELKRRGYGRFLSVPLSGVTKENEGVWSLIWSANGTVLVRKSTQELDALIVGSLLGPAALGDYHIARRLGQAIAKLGATLQQATFPELARAWTRRSLADFIRLIKQVELTTAAVGFVTLLIAALNAELIVRLVAGRDFSDAVTPLVIQMCAVFLFLCGSTLRPALMSMGLQLQMFAAVAASAIIFYIVMLVAVPRLGIAGASLAHLAFNATWLPVAAWAFARGLRNASQARQAHPDPVRA
ncbi:MAG TPA: lipopolysaccharide biosynthesis protein [Sphingomonas sp.]|nr:lipopolysaccharide biosynthesis protein [Sphingomonas sp.]